MSPYTPKSKKEIRKAEIRNALMLPKTALHMLVTKNYLPYSTLKEALESLDEAIGLIKEYD